MGDRIRFVRMPVTYSRPDYQVDPGTLAFYELLISTGDSLEIEDFVDGRPVAGYVDRRNFDSPTFHGLIIDEIDDGCWERASEAEGTAADPPK